jgi:hypothetical protein
MYAALSARKSWGEEVQPWQTFIIDHYRGIDDDRCLL